MVEWPLKYLGLHLDGNWVPIGEKVRKRLDGWKSTFLCEGENSLLFSLFTPSSYLLALLKIRIEVAFRIEKL